MNSYKILVIEDEKNICNFMKMILETGGYQPLFAGNGKNGLLMFYSHHPDIVILDLGLPDMDGMEVIEEIRKQSETPVIVLSARTGEQDKIEALDLGANDYITKPFGTGELLARVRASLRTNRFQGLEPKSLKHFKLYDLEINYDARKVTIAGEEVRLTQTEYNIVSLLSACAGKVLTYADIIKKYGVIPTMEASKNFRSIWQTSGKKFGEKPGEYRYILNELGVGYRMNDEE